MLNLTGALLASLERRRRWPCHRVISLTIPELGSRRCACFGTPRSRPRRRRQRNGASTGWCLLNASVRAFVGHELVTSGLHAASAPVTGGGKVRELARAAGFGERLDPPHRQRTMSQSDHWPSLGNPYAWASRRRVVVAPTPIPTFGSSAGGGKRVVKAFVTGTMRRPSSRPATAASSGSSQESDYRRPHRGIVRSRRRPVGRAFWIPADELRRGLADGRRLARRQRSRCSQQTGRPVTRQSRFTPGASPLITNVHPDGKPGERQLQRES